jgi:hypothetical protein
VEEEKGDENIDPDNNPDVLRLQGEIGRLCDNAAAAAERDDIDKAQELMFQVDKLQGERQTIIVSFRTVINTNTTHTRHLKNHECDGIACAYAYAYAYASVSACTSEQTSRAAEGANAAHWRRCEQEAARMRRLWIIPVDSRQ